MKPNEEPLTPEEDGTLRRLHFFESMGTTLSEENRLLKQEIRGRDKRESIRAPGEVWTGRTDAPAPSA